MADQAVTYPAIVPGPKGYRIQISKGAHLPGYFIGHITAEKALKRYLGEQVTASAKKKSNKK